MDRVIDHVLETYRNRIDEKQITVKVKQPLPPVMGKPLLGTRSPAKSDRQRGQIYWRGQRRPVYRYIRAARCRNATYYIKDNGVGISEENQERLFEMFSRFDKTLADGFGLGMSIATRLVNKMDGSIGVESKRGVGSTFWVSLPT